MRFFAFQNKDFFGDPPRPSGAKTTFYDPEQPKAAVPLYARLESDKNPDILSLRSAEMPPTHYSASKIVEPVVVGQPLKASISELTQKFEEKLILEEAVAPLTQFGPRTSNWTEVMGRLAELGEQTELKTAQIQDFESSNTTVEEIMVPFFQKLSNFTDDNVES